MSSKIVDVSNEGVRLEIQGASPSVLPPYFTLRVPGFGVQAKVKRVWVAMPAQGSMWISSTRSYTALKTRRVAGSMSLISRVRSRRLS